MKQLVLVVGAALAVVGPAGAQDFSFHRDLAGGSKVWVRNVIGDVKVEATSGRQLEVTARKKAGKHGDPEDVEIKAIEANGGVAICVYYPNQSSSRSRSRDDDRDRDRDAEPSRARSRHRDREQDQDRDDDSDRPSRRRSHGHDDDPCHRQSDWNGNNRNDTEVNFLVRLPAGLVADIKTVSGDLIGQGLRGTLDLGTVSGDLHLSDIQADELDAASVSGSVVLDRVSAREVSAETVSGDVSYVGTIDPKGSYDFKTLSGDVTVTLPREPDAKMSAVTFSGDVSSDFPVQGRDRRHRNRFNATWGAGTAQLDLESFSGDIKIRSSR